MGPCADVRRSSSQEAALALAAERAETMRTAAGQWGFCADVRRSPSQGAALAVAVRARHRVEIHRMLTHASEEITQKTAQAMEIVTGQWGLCEVRLQAEAKRQAVQ